MKTPAWLCGLGMGLVVAGAGGALVACANNPDAKFGKIQAGELPAGESWIGVYYNPVYGYLHLVEQDGNVVGRWKRTDSSHWGELSGQAEGNVLHYTWKEHQYGALGPASDTHGNGVFVFKEAKGDRAPPELDGQYALDDSDSVGQWHCVKQLNVKPDLQSINGDNPTDSAGQDRWH
jgi:hypothetical protein